ncbi:hypothetical protein Tsp_05532 [Trichinella spiralis]|uniref:hypothetical protein n=1 Tax=Trichinella spiralis TaxID=6334 RepID=UPI0001EFDDBC|nr:hypothetical protein Tsp_05532 [Trichinella spiralis]
MNGSVGGDSFPCGRGKNFNRRKSSADECAFLSNLTSNLRYKKPLFCTFERSSKRGPDRSSTKSSSRRDRVYHSILFWGLIFRDRFQFAADDDDVIVVDYSSICSSSIY